MPTAEITVVTYNALLKTTNTNTFADLSTALYTAASWLGDSAPDMVDAADWRQCFGDDPEYPVEGNFAVQDGSGNTAWFATPEEAYAAFEERLEECFSEKGGIAFLRPGEKTMDITRDGRKTGIRRDKWSA